MTTQEEGYHSDISFNENKNNLKSSATLREVSKSNSADSVILQNHTSITSSDILSNRESEEEKVALPEKELMMLEQQANHNPEHFIQGILNTEEDESVFENQFIND